MSSLRVRRVLCCAEFVYVRVFRRMEMWDERKTRGEKTRRPGAMLEKWSCVCRSWERREDLRGEMTSRRTLQALVPW